MNGRYVVMGLARVRSEWFTQLGTWANTSALPMEFQKCVSAAELHSRLDSGRAVSAVVVDATVGGLDRDLIDHALGCGSAVIVVADQRVDRDWQALGASAELRLPMTPGDFLAVLNEVSEPVSNVVLASDQPDCDEPSPRWQGNLVAVTGAGGTGTSTVASSAAQALAARAGNRDQVLLADLALNADQAMYHGSPDIIPGLQEIVEAHRASRPTTASILDSLHIVESRGYAMLLGLRRPSDWTALPSRSSAAAIGSLRGLFRWTVADLDSCFEGEKETGSLDIEDRNFLTRHCLRTASVVLVTARPTLQGIHRLARIVSELCELGVNPAVLQTVVSEAPRSRRARAEITSTAGSLCGVLERSPIYLPSRNLEQVHRTVSALPHPICKPLVAAIEHIANATTPLLHEEPTPVKTTHPARTVEWQPGRAS